VFAFSRYVMCGRLPVSELRKYIRESKSSFKVRMDFSDGRYGAHMRAH
jgi:hypothetical protein